MRNVFAYEIELGFSRLEVQSCTVYTESLACWIRAIIEHMAEMAITLPKQKEERG